LRCRQGRRRGWRAWGPPSTTFATSFSLAGNGGTLRHDSREDSSLRVNGVDVRTQRMDRTLGMILQWDEPFDIGSDTLTGVNDADYRPPFAFTGKLNRLTIKIDRPQLSPEDIKKLEAAMRGKAATD
jgi:hypothetical protein